MVRIEEPIDMFRVTHHFDMKQSAAIELERLNEALLLCLEVKTIAFANR